MAKLDVSLNVTAQDDLLAKLENPLHRQIIENYRRHSLLESLGRWQEILTPDMTVEHPEYRVNVTGEGGILRGVEEIGKFYAQWVSTGQNVLVVQDEEIAVGDRGFGKESFISQFFTGAALRALGFDVDDPEGWYVKRAMLISYWPYDERGRMIGEHSTSFGSPDIYKIDASEVITQEENDAKLTPLLRPLPKFGGK
jgi:hypothetical protein